MHGEFETPAKPEDHHARFLYGEAETWYERAEQNRANADLLEATGDEILERARTLDPSEWEEF